MTESLPKFYCPSSLLLSSIRDPHAPKKLNFDPELLQESMKNRKLSMRAMQLLQAQTIVNIRFAEKF